MQYLSGVPAKAVQELYYDDFDGPGQRVLHHAAVLFPVVPAAGYDIHELGVWQETLPLAVLFESAFLGFQGAVLLTRLPGGGDPQVAYGPSGS